MISERRRRAVALVFVAIGLGLIPWSLFLALTLPSRHVQKDFYDVGWTGFDVLLASMLALTGFGLRRRRLWVQATAASAATLLVCDAWFDVLGSSRHGERLVALVLAIVVELPIAAVCVLVASNAEAAGEGAHRYVRFGPPDDEAQEPFSET